MSVMKVIYIANARLPTEKAHGLQITKMCSAFARQGCAVSLVLPSRINEIGADIHEYYKLDEAVKIFKLGGRPLKPINSHYFGPAIFYWQSLVFAQSVRKFIKEEKTDGAVLYTRDLLPMLFAPGGRPMVFEAHGWPERLVWLFRFLLRRFTVFVVITRALKNLFVKAGVAERKIFIAPDAVEIKDFLIDLNREECRRKTGLPLDKKISLYSGHLYRWKGVDNIIEAAKQFADDTLFVVVGGTEKDIKLYQERVASSGLEKRILVAGHKKHEEVPYYLGAADSLLLPNMSESKISSLYTSPLKLFEYMAARRPIVASNLRSIGEILDSSSAIMVEPDNISALADGIRIAHAGGEEVKKRVAMAAEKVRVFTWDARASGILDFIRNSV